MVRVQGTLADVHRSMWPPAMDLQGYADQNGGASTATTGLQCNGGVPYAMPPGCAGEGLQSWECRAEVPMFLEEKNLTR